METIENRILTSVKKCGRGTYAFAKDFLRFGDTKSISKALERLANENIFIRIGRGIYYYPKIDKQFGLGVLLPTIDETANAIAKRDKARIVPTGEYAVNRLGFSTQIPMNVVYLTDGNNRKIVLCSGATIQFKHTSTKNLAYKSKLAMLICFAYKSLGKELISEEIKTKTKQLLKKEPQTTVQQDYKLMPAWISTILRSLYEE